MFAKTPEQITVAEAARAARVTAHTIRQWIHDGKLPATKTITNTWRIAPEDLAVCLRRSQYVSSSIQG